MPMLQSPKPISAKMEFAMARAARSLAIVTGASSGIGFELARCCIENGFDIVAAADDPHRKMAEPQHDKK
jgi:NAD(P)-dependent dehydrogenase (short-subunit alcohol dehydrogenase family)